MDPRTRQMIDALKHPGAAAVFKLLQNGPMTEDELVREVEESSQATMNRRLKELGELGLLSRAAGPRQYKERPWKVTVEAATDSLYAAALGVSEAIAAKDDESREKMSGALREGRKRRSQLRAVGDEEDESQ
jgi:DNA-binding HxlR family transcriptional regulator